LNVWTLEASSMEREMYRIYFDSNEGAETACYGLWSSRSIEDLRKIPDGPKNGMRVTIYMIGEIEMEAELEWNEQCNAWTARPIAGTMKENHDTWN
jgi:hypothetical protein